MRSLRRSTANARRGGTPPADSAPGAVETSVERLQQRLGYTFRDQQLLRQALTHKSASASNFERFEFLGDAALGLAVAQLLFDTWPDASEQQLTLMRAKLVNANALADNARRLELGRCLKLSVSERRSGGADRTSILADAFEAMLGVIVCDGGFEAAAEVVRRVFLGQLTQPDDVDLKDPKTRLQEHLQARGMGLPSYSLLAKHGADHALEFLVECSVDGLDVRAQGRARSLRKAETAAAATVLRRLER